MFTNDPKKALNKKDKDTKIVGMKQHFRYPAKMYVRLNTSSDININS